MNYVVYADIMLVWIFFINYVTYYITCRLLSHSISTKTIILWCLISSVVSELMYLGIYKLDTSYIIPAYICLNMLLMVVFLRYITKTHNLRGIIRLLSYQFLSMLILSGLLQLFKEKHVNPYPYIPVIIIICLYLPKIHTFFLGSVDMIKNIHPVTIYTGSGAYKTKGYMDTGNTLIDPYTNKPVIIMDQNIAMSIITSDTRKYLIPYKTISSSYNTMECFSIKGIKIGDSGIIPDVTVAISPTPFTNGEEYKILLNINLK